MRTIYQTVVSQQCLHCLAGPTQNVSTLPLEAATGARRRALGYALFVIEHQKYQQLRCSVSVAAGVAVD